MALITWHFNAKQITFWYYKLKILIWGIRCYMIKSIIEANCGKCRASMFRGSLKISDWTTHTFSIIWIAWGTKYHLFSLSVAWRMWWIIQHPFECLNSSFKHPNKIGVAKYVVIKVLCASTLNVQKFMFKIIMKSYAKIVLHLLNIINPLTKM